jgi:hypothetical protein
MTTESTQKGWEYYTYYAAVGGTMTSSPSDIWSKKHKSLDGESQWDQIARLGKLGWELVSASPWSGRHEGLSTGMVFVFKRPLV